MSDKTALWIKDPLAILADNAERGIVVEDGRIVELVPAGRSPATPAAEAPMRCRRLRSMTVFPRNMRLRRSIPEMTTHAAEASRS